MRQIAPRVAVVLAAIAFATLRPASAGPVPFSSDNVTLLAHIPDPGAVGGRFVGNTFYLTTVTGLRIYDVSDATLPKLAGALALPHFENEDVDVSVSRKLVLISGDRWVNRQAAGGAVAAGAGGVLFVIDVSNPATPLVKSALPLPAFTGPPDEAGGSSAGPGHIANCIDDCARYAWITGARDGSIFVVDLEDPAAPTLLRTRISTYAGRPNSVFTGGVIHDVNVDRFGDVWVTGSGGTAMLDATDPVHPVIKSWVSLRDNGKWNQFIHHNSLRLDRRTVLVTEEDYEHPQCGAVDDPTDQLPGEQGGFQTWQIQADGTGTLRFLDQWTTEMGQFTDGGSRITSMCSSHWFDLNRRKVVAVGWYNQGVRFLDVSDPRSIRQVGYWLAPGEQIGLGVSQALWVPAHQDIAYAVSYTRGLDVLRVDRGGARAATVRAPILPAWTHPAEDFWSSVEPHPTFGYACLVPRSDR